MQEVQRASDRRVAYLPGLVHLERGDGQKALAALKNAGEAAHESEQPTALATALSQATTLLVTGGKCRAVLRGHRGEIVDVALTADGRYGLSCDRFDRRLLWDVQLGVQMGELAAGGVKRSFRGDRGSCHQPRRAIYCLVRGVNHSHLGAILGGLSEDPQRTYWHNMVRGVYARRQISAHCQLGCNDTCLGGGAR